MSKIITLAVYVTLLIILFNAGGLIPAGGSSYLLDKVGVIDLATGAGDPGNNALYNIVFGISAIALVGIVSFLSVTGSSLDTILFAAAGSALIPVLFAIIQDLISIYKLLGEVNILLANLLFAPIVILFIFSIYEWIGGKN